jgi:Na+/proline symporter
VVRIGRFTTGVIMVLAMLWSTQVDQFGTVFVLGLLWKRGRTPTRSREAR